MMKFVSLACCFLLLSGLSAQDIITTAADEGCTCLKALNPEDFTERQIPFKILNCLAERSDEVEAELKKRGTFKDEPFEAVTAIRNEAYKRCPEEFERLNKEREKIEVDPALLIVDSNTEIIPGLSDAICRCVEITKEKDWSECMTRVMEANQESLEYRLIAQYKDRGVDNLFKAMTHVGLDLALTLIDRCEALADDEMMKKFKAYPAVKDGCDKLILGEYTTETMLGEVKAVVSANRYTEYDANGKLTEDYELKWNGCHAALLCKKSTHGFVKKGETLKMEIKRASADGYLGVIYYGHLPAPHLFIKKK